MAVDGPSSEGGAGRSGSAAVDVLMGMEGSRGLLSGGSLRITRLQVEDTASAKRHGHSCRLQETTRVQLPCVYMHAKQQEVLRLCIYQVLTGQGGGDAGKGGVCLIPGET